MSALDDLRAVAQLSDLTEGDSAEEQAASTAVSTLADCAASLQLFLNAPGLTGQTGTAATTQAHSLLSQVQSIQSKLSTWTSANTTARNAMRTAAKQLDGLTSLIPDQTTVQKITAYDTYQPSSGKLRSAAAMATYVKQTKDWSNDNTHKWLTGTAAATAYTAAQTATANAKAQQILDTMNAAVQNAIPGPGGHLQTSGSAGNTGATTQITAAGVAGFSGLGGASLSGADYSVAGGGAGFDAASGQAGGGLGGTGTSPVGVSGFGGLGGTSADAGLSLGTGAALVQGSAPSFSWGSNGAAAVGIGLGGAAALAAAVGLGSGGVGGMSGLSASLGPAPAGGLIEPTPGGAWGGLSGTSGDAAAAGLGTSGSWRTTGNGPVSAEEDAATGRFGAMGAGNTELDAGGAWASEGGPAAGAGSLDTMGAEAGDAGASQTAWGTGAADATEAAAMPASSSAGGAAGMMPMTSAGGAGGDDRGRRRIGYLVQHVDPGNVDPSDPGWGAQAGSAQQLPPAPEPEDDQW